MIIKNNCFQYYKGIPMLYDYFNINIEIDYVNLLYSTILFTLFKTKIIASKYFYFTAFKSKL